jgi:ATP-binding cassette subfamily B (MDR/TAP) protein 1
MEELDFGEELHEVQSIPDHRRSIYPSSTAITTQVDSHPVPPARPRHVPDPLRPRFRRLFSLHTRSDYLLLLAPAVITAIAGGLAQPYMSIVVGEAFQVFADYPLELSTVTVEDVAALSLGIKMTSLKLTLAGLATILLNYVRGALWIRHGESMIRRLRQKVFIGVQAKGMEWFDLGMGLDPDEVDEDGEKADNIGAGGLMAKFTK